MSDKFKFRLATVLRVARIREEAEQRRMSAAAATAETAHAVAEQRRLRFDELGSLTPSPAEEFSARIETAALRASALHRAGEERDLAAARLASARDDLLARARHTRTLEELEDRHLALHVVQASRAAQRSLDDLARMRRRTA